MEQEVYLVFPHQLHRNSPLFQTAKSLVLIEEHLFFTQFSFHRQKLVFHRASMKHFEQEMISMGKTVQYICFHEYKNLQELLQRWKGLTLNYHETDDFLLEKRLQKACINLQIERKKHESCLFINPLADTISLLQKSKKPLMASFYIEQRRKHNILLQADGSPEGDKWSFDTENRKRLPKGLYVPPIARINQTTEVNEAISYVKKWFPQNPGSLEGFNWPVNRDQAHQAAEQFFKERFTLFGPYEDAMSKEETFLFHSALSPLINVGLIEPRQLIERATEQWKTHQAPLSGVEGFIRQILGWREFMRGVYHVKGVSMRNSNHFAHNKTLNAAFYEGRTGIKPLDDSIHKALNHAYTHHIERLMVQGNYLLLAAVHPHAAYKWFMEMYIDAYDWVMVPNVYGMSLYADGGGITTKPYASGSNYIHNMSDYKKDLWSETWDALYWNFIARNRDSFVKNPRMSMMVKLLEKQSPERRQKLENEALNVIMKQETYTEDTSVERVS